MNPPKPATQSPGPFSSHLNALEESLSASLYKCLESMSSNILLGSISRITVLG